MSEVQNQNEPELIIVRRRTDHDLNAVKGGVWKIAHADFMTAMMAFFLVMWLASSTDEATRRDIAQYFNPVKLSEMSPHPKGLEDPDQARPTPEEESMDDGSPAVSKGGSDSISLEPTNFGNSGERTYQRGTTSFQNLPTYTEAEIFSDPYGILNRIVLAAEQSELREVEKQDVSLNEQKVGNKGGVALRDPFDPLYWQMHPESDDTAQDVATLPDANRVDPMLSDKSIVKAIITGNDPSDEITPEPSTGLRVANLDEGRVELAALSSPIEGISDSKESDINPALFKNEKPLVDDASKSALQAADPSKDAKAAEGDQAVVSKKALTEPAGDSEELKRYKAILAEELGKSPRLDIGKELTVTNKGDGLLIDVTDSPTWGMFAVGSSEPSARSIALLEKIANSLKKVEGKIIIRGHTDGRPFHRKDYDNWRLSTARAHMARYMLIRGGLDEKRLLRVEGYADQELKVPGDPEADANRRIEILVQPVRESKS